MTSRTLLSVVALLGVLALGGYYVVKLLNDPAIWPPDDYVEYWAAGRLNLFGQNPYSADNLLPLEQHAGRQTDEAVMMWNPPWTLSLVMPLGALPPRIGQLLWLILGLGAIGLSAWLVWKSYGGPRDKGWIAIAISFLFIPSLFTLQSGQISALLLLGAAGFVHCVKRGYLVAAGAFACLIAIKPHLAYLVWLAVGLDALVNRQWRIVIGGVFVGVIITVIPTVFNPSVWSQYVEAFCSSPVPPSKWISLTPGVILRFLFGQELFWLQFVPMAVGLMWFVWNWRKNGRTWNWAEQMPWLIVVSFVTAPYGAWHFDIVLLLLPILHRAAWCANRVHPVTEETQSTIESTPTRPLWIVLLVALGLTNISMFVMMKLNMYSYWYAWVAPLVLLGYVMTAKRSKSAQSIPALLVQA